MAEIEWYATAYGMYLLLMVTSMASIGTSRGRCHRVGGLIRVICFTLTGVLALVFQIALFRAETSVTAQTIHIFTIVVVMSILWALINFAPRREWAQLWNFSSPRLPSGGRIDLTVDHDRWTRGWLCGWLLHMIGVTLGAVAVFCASYLGTPRWPVALAPIAAGAGAGIANWGRRVRLKARRAHARRIESPDVLPQGSYVLYLRMFEADQRHAVILPTRNITMDLTDMLLPGSSEEEDLAEVMRPVGPMVAVGIPGEELPHAGAMRMYLPMIWKPPVRQMIMNARLVVIEIGVGAGTVWEVAEALRTLPPQRLLLIVPEEMTDKEYELVRRRVSGKLRGQGRSKPRMKPRPNSRQVLPPRPSSKNPNGRGTGFIFFSDDWKAISTTGHSLPWHPTRDFFGVVAKSVTPLFSELKAYEERTGRLWG